ncbi:hypothetical protein M1146_05610 [Patescibacteria group bacterium]|nr:hypothetical protein [Patescibacteria group bacterium]
MLKKIVKTLRNNKGGGMIDWMIVIAVIAVIAITAIPRINGQVETKVTDSLDRLEQVNPNQTNTNP